MIRPEHVPPTAQVLRIGVARAGNPRGLEFPWSVDEEWSGCIRVTYPAPLPDEADRVLPFVTLGVGVYLAQLCLAPVLEVDPPLHRQAKTDILPIAQMLYDIRCWKDRRPLLPSLAIRSPEAQDRCLAGPARRADSPTTTLLMSGGKDSTLSAVRLLSEGWSVRGLHLAVNHGVEERELMAAQDIAGQLGVPLDVIAVEHPEFLAFSTRYAVEWNRFPLCNVVPFGRDLLTTVLALPHLAASGLATLSLGHDAECRGASVEHEGKRIPRNDIESTEGADALERAIQSSAIPGFEFLPPVADLDELEILRRMLTDHLHLMVRTSFCFWGGNCGRCAKCLRYHLAQRVFLAQDALQFQVDPLAAGANLELDEVLSAPTDDPPQLFEEQVLRCIGWAVRRGRIDPEEGALAGRFDAMRPRIEMLIEDSEPSGTISLSSNR